MHIFYSFSLKHDGALVLELSKAMEKLGYKPANPVDRHIYAHNWRLQLVDALRKSDGAVLIVTPKNLKDKYVMGELWAARVLSRINKRFVMIPVLNGTSRIPDYLSDLYVANSSGKVITDIEALASQIDKSIRDNLKFEINISDLKPRVFIGHGHSKDWKKVAEFVQKELNLVVEEFETISAVGYTVTARLEQMLTVSSLAIIVMSADDEQKDKTLRARQNVIHEIGFCQGRLGFEKVVVVRHNDCQSFSNVSGIIEIPYDLDNWDEVFSKIQDVAEREGLLSNDTNEGV